jgi:hypothetical protein
VGVNADFRADFSTFIDAINQADLKLADMGKGAEKVEGQLNAMVDKFSGRALIQQASELTIAIDKLGGVSTLTAREIEVVGNKANEAVEKLHKLGYEVPKGLQDLADATKQASTANTEYAASWLDVGAKWVSSIAAGQILADMFWKLVDVAKQAALELPKIALAGSAFASVEDNFRHLTEQAGLLSDALLGDLNTATHNTVSNLELMQTVNQDLAAGMKLSRSEFAAMGQAAFALAQAEGIGVTEALQKVNNALLTGREASLGRIVDLGKIKQAEEDLAAAQGRKLSDMSQEDQLWIKREAMLGQVIAATERLGTQTDSLGEHVAQTQKSWGDFLLELGKAIATSPVLEAGFQGVKGALEAAFGGSQKSLIDAIRQAIDDTAIMAVQFGHVAVGVGGEVAQGFVEWKAILGTIQQQFNYVQLAMLEAERASLWFDSLAGKSAVIARQMDENAAAINRVKTAMDEQRKSNDENGASVAKISATVQKLHEGLDATEAAMRKAAAATTDHAAATSDLGVKVGETDQTVGRYNNTLKEHSKSAEQMAADERKLLEAWRDLNSVGTDYLDTLNTMDQGTREVVQALLAQGASMKTLAEVFTLTASQTKAFTEQQAINKQAALDVTQLWNEYNTLVGDGSSTAYERAGAAIDKWYADSVAKHQAAKTDTAAFYEAVAALDDAKWAKLNQNTLEADKNSREYAQKKATDDEGAYQFALAHADSFNQHYIEGLRLNAEASRIAADTFGLAYVENASKATAAIQVFDAAVNKTAADAAAADAAQRNSFQFTGAMAVDPKFANMSTEAKRLAGYIDLYGRVTPFGQQVGFGYSAGGQGRAAGGPVSADTPYVVGEQGPELFVPSINGAILPNMAGTGGVVIHNVFNIVDTEAGITRRVADNIARSLTRGTKLS